VTAKLKIEYIREQLKLEGFTLLSTKYENVHQKLSYLCPKGHKHSASWQCWKNSNIKCPICSKMVKPTIEFIESQFKKEKYTLLTKSYKNNSQKLKFICPSGHKYSISWNNWRAGRRCAICFKNAHFTLKQVKSSFQKEGYTLLSSTYKNAHTNLEYICPNGHQHSITWNNWHHGDRCPYCSNHIQKTIEEIRDAFNKEGFTLLSTHYKHSQQKLEYICPKGHHHSVSWSAWRLGGIRCPYCSNKAKPTIDFIRDELKKEKYTLLSNHYINCDTKLKYKCPRNHLHAVSWDGWKQGNRCPKCQRERVKKQVSKIIKQKWKDPIYQKMMQKAYHRKPNKPEKFLTNLLNQLFPNEYKYVGDFQFFLGGKNPDFLNVDHQRKLIELYGTYWHKNDDPQKRIDFFKQYDYDTCVIWESELKSQNTLISKLQEFHRSN